MPRVREVVEWLDERFPPFLAEEWDNTGLLLGDASRDISRVMTCLTLTEAVATEAVDGGVGLVVTHHPVLFRGAKSLTAATPQGRTVMRLLENRVAVHSPHTRFDSATEGINARIAKTLSLRDVNPIRASAEDAAVGGGRVGDLAEPLTVDDFAAAVAAALDVDGLHTVVAGRETVSRVAIACGAAGDFLADAADAGADAFIVGECRFHAAVEAEERGVALFVPGHFASERHAVVSLAGEIADAFPGVSADASQVDRDPLVWVSFAG